MSNVNDWLEAGSGNGDTWKPENVGDTITGTLKQVKTNVGQNNSNVYMILEEGKSDATSVWGSAVLDTKFEEIPVGSMVRIEFIGREKGKSPMPYKNFKVMYKPAPETAKSVFPEAEVIG